MQIYIRVKSAGKRRDLLQPAAYTISDHTASLRQLIEAVVEAEADRCNQKGTDAQMIPSLTATQINDQAETGKVSFGTVFSERKADKEKPPKTQFSAGRTVWCGSLWRTGSLRNWTNPCPFQKTQYLHLFA